MSTNEELIWEDSSSQFLNFGKHSISVILLTVAGVGALANPMVPMIGVPIIGAWTLWNYLTIKCQKFKLTNQRMIMQRGVLNRVTDEIELYRVKDHRLEQPFFLRMFGLGNIILISSDQLNHEIIIPAVKDSENLRESIRKLVEARRVSRGVRELDTN